MHRGQDLHRGAKEGEAADSNRTEVKHHTIEVEEHPLAEPDIGAVVAEKGWLHPYRLASRSEQLAQHASPGLLFRFPRRVQRLTLISSIRAGRGQFGIPRVLEFSGQHFLPLCFHRRSPGHVAVAAMDRWDGSAIASDFNVLMPVMGPTVASPPRLSTP